MCMWVWVWVRVGVLEEQKQNIQVCKHAGNIEQMTQSESRYEHSKTEDTKQPPVTNLLIDV